MCIKYNNKRVLSHLLFLDRESGISGKIIVLLKPFKGVCSSPEIITLFVYMKYRFSLSYRDLQEMAHIRGVAIDHATLQRWIIRFVHMIDIKVIKRKKPVLAAGEWMKPISK